MEVLTWTALSLPLECQVMRAALGFLSGLVGMLAGWFGLAFLVIALAGPDRDGGVAMGAFFSARLARSSGSVSVSGYS